MSEERPPDERLPCAAATADRSERQAEEEAERFFEELDKRAERISITVVVDVAQMSVVQIDHAFRGLAQVIKAARP